MTINLSTLLGAITIPAGVEYDPEFPHRNAENFYRAALQILQQLSAVSFVIADATDAGNQAAIVQALKDLKFNDIILDFGFLKVNLTGNALEY